MGGKGESIMRHLSTHRVWAAIVIVCVLIAGFLAGGAVMAGASSTVLTMHGGDTVTANCDGSRGLSWTGTGSQRVIACKGTSPVTTSPAPSSSTPVPTSTAPTSSSPAPTATAPTTSSSPPPTGFPNASNTGVPAGTVLRTVANGDSGPCWNVANGNLYVTCSTTLDSLNVPFVLKVMANNVTVTRSKITAASYYTVNTCDCPTYYSGLNLTDDDIDGGLIASSQSIAVMANPNATYLRDNFHGFASSGPRLDSGDLLQDSYIHDFVCQNPDHSAGTSINNGGSNLRIIHNNIDINTTAAGCASAAIELSPQDFGGVINGATIDSNLIAGGAYCAYLAETNTASSNIAFTNNVLSKKYNPTCGLYGPVAEVASGNGNTFSGNAYDDGTPVN
jgi:hypothetical protein